MNRVLSIHLNADESAAVAAVAYIRIERWDAWLDELERFLRTSAPELYSGAQHNDPATLVEDALFMFLVDAPYHPPLYTQILADLLREYRSAALEWDPNPGLLPGEPAWKPGEWARLYDAVLNTFTAAAAIPGAHVSLRTTAEFAA